MADSCPAPCSSSSSASQEKTVTAPAAPAIVVAAASKRRRVPTPSSIPVASEVAGEASLAGSQQSPPAVSEGRGKGGCGDNAIGDVEQRRPSPAPALASGPATEAAEEGDAAPFLAVVPDAATSKNKRQWDAWTNGEFTAFFEAVVKVCACVYW